MRLFELVPCGRWAVPQDDPSPPSMRRVDGVSPHSPKNRASPEKHQRRTAPGSAEQWRPSLGAISEDGVAAAKEETRAARHRQLKAKKAAASRALPRANANDYRHYGVPTVIPAFAPTAFLF